MTENALSRLANNSETSAQAAAPVAAEAAPEKANPLAPPPGYDPREELMDRVVAAIKTCYDPEIPVDIWELGLIYRVDMDGQRNVEIDMTLTSPMCPVAGELPEQVRQAVLGVEDVNEVKIDLVWEPPWHQGMMSEVARLQLDMF
ncbi:FeS assembly SUF system protein [Azospirillum agricola]|uniref:iron-sulfur cluster assembly protein n=1 Tax=Azospirillum agricola TaxID=1720247 RepID=UPI001AEA8B7D|nr:iron-sulfur cluster assembly protein [Azospirillum agricola]MBP2231563.1 FeS assembly SUF system protein [Azospirillum agricola]